MEDSGAREDAAGLEACSTAPEGVVLAREEAQHSVCRPGTQSGPGGEACKRDSTAGGDGASDLADAVRAAPDGEPSSRPSSSALSDSGGSSFTPTMAPLEATSAGNAAGDSWRLQLIPLDDGTVAVSICQQQAGPGKAAASPVEAMAHAPPPPDPSVERAQIDDAVAAQQQQQLEQLEQLRALQEERQALLEENQRLQWFARQVCADGSNVSMPTSC